MLKQERQQRREEEEAAEKVREAGGRVEVAVTVETTEKMLDDGLSVTRDGEDKDLTM